MQVNKLPFEGLVLAISEAKDDQRGIFRRLFCEISLAPILGSRRIVQINQSTTHNKGSLRGMHFQLNPHAEMKLIRCLQGAVYDVAVDLRPQSATFKQHFSIELCASDGKLFVIPEGFAHGFQALENETSLLYLHTAKYAPTHERGILHNDPQLNIRWPLPVIDLSLRDANLPLFNLEHYGN